MHQREVEELAVEEVVVVVVAVVVVCVCTYVFLPKQTFQRLKIRGSPSKENLVDHSWSLIITPRNQQQI